MTLHATWRASTGVPVYVACYHRVVGEALGQSPRRPGRPSRPRRVARLLGWNALILFGLLALAAGGAEAYLRLAAPSFGGEAALPARMVPGVGVIRPPGAEIRYLYGAGFRQASRANSLGFVDREPPGPKRAAESCHVTLIGDSFVEALEVAIADKAQVRLEELAAREAPELDVTTSAFGFRGTGQINQLAFYDAYARRLSPDVVVLVAAQNDFLDNSLPVKAWHRGFHPDYPPWLFARDRNGEMEFVPPAADLDELRANLLSRLLAEPEVPRERWWLRPPAGMETTLRARSHLVDWLWRTLDGAGQSGGGGSVLRARAEWLSRHPRHATFRQGWHASYYEEGLLREERPPPVYREALDVTRFALEQFRERAERDGAALVVLAIYEFGMGDAWSDGWLDLLRELAAGSGGGGYSRHQPV